MVLAVVKSKYVTDDKIWLYCTNSNEKQNLAL